MARFMSLRLMVAFMTAPVLTACGSFVDIDPSRCDPNECLARELDDLCEIFADLEDERAAETYLTEGAEVTPWVKNAWLPSADNAALLWYQAFLSRPEPDEPTRVRINEVLRGGKADGQVRQYLGYCRKTFRLAEMAAQIPQCTWGVSLPDGTGASGGMTREAHHLTSLLAADARTLASDAHYRVALARCLTIRRLAHHVGDDTPLMFSVSIAIDSMARRAMQYVLGVTPPETNTLRWLRGQLGVVEGAPGSLEKVLQTNLRFLPDEMRKDADVLQGIRERIAEETLSEQAREEALGLSEEEIITRACRAYSRLLDQVLRVLDSGMSYEQKYAEIGKQTRELTQRSDPAARYAAFWCQAGRITDSYGLIVCERAAYNALKAAIEIYMVVAETGALPHTLPLYLPKDPFSGEPFAYEITGDGFVLRCRSRDLDSSKKLYRPGEAPEILEDVIQQYEFKVRR